VEVKFSIQALDDLSHWRRSGNKKAQQKITELTKSVLQTPFHGIGKPEPLKHKMAGLWSRRITRADRYIYEIQEELIIVHSLRGHYE
jgi:toxin YoeB